MSSRRSTVLQLVPALETGGAERTTIDIARALVEDGWTALVASAGGRMVGELEAVGARHFELPLDRKNPIALWRNSRALDAIFKEHQVNLLHARSRGPAWSGLWSARRMGVPLVTTWHGAYARENALKGYYNSVMARGDQVIANSRWTAKGIAEMHPWAADRITAIPRGTDFAAFDRTAIAEDRLTNLRRAWSVGDRAFVFLHLARLTGWKGQDVVVNAVSQIVDEYPDVLVILAGDAQGREAYLNGLKAKISDFGLEEQVRLPGHCDDPAAAMALADAVVVASTKPEAFGRAAVEAGALEKPVIVTDIGAVSETVVSEKEGGADSMTGWKVPPGDSKALATTMRAVLKLSPQQRKAIGARARRRGIEHFSLERMCESTLEVYRKTLTNSAD